MQARLKFLGQWRHSPTLRASAAVVAGWLVLSGVTAPWDRPEPVSHPRALAPDTGSVPPATVAPEAADSADSADSATPYVGAQAAPMLHRAPAPGASAAQQAAQAAARALQAHFERHVLNAFVSMPCGSSAMA